MRHTKGSIELSPVQDVPLLRQVLHSKVITHHQLFDFMRLGSYEIKRSSFNWRTRRLVEHGFLHRDYLPEIARSYLYRIAPQSALITEFAIFLPEKSRAQDIRPRVCKHAIELNEIHLSLLREPGLLEEWISETSIVSENVLTRSGYAKDYDAVVTVRFDDRASTFALEYERSVKRKSNYRYIRERIESEERLDRFLYLAADFHLLSYLSHCFASTRAGLYVALARDFKSSLLDTPVVDTFSGTRTTLREAL